MINLDSILKSRDITLPTKVHLVKAMVFPVLMYGCESWIIKKPDRRRIDAFELWCWRILLRVPWTAKRSNQSILKEISPGCSLEGLMFKLKLQYFGHLMQTADSLEKTDAGKDWRQEEKGTTEDEMVGLHHQLNAHGFRWTPGVGDDREAWRAAVYGVTKSWIQLSDWTELNWLPGKWRLQISWSLQSVKTGFANGCWPCSCSWDCREQGVLWLNTWTQGSERPGLEFQPGPSSAGWLATSNISPPIKCRW